MEYLNVFVMGDNQVNEEKPPPRVCPRCNSDNTKFCYYNNYRVTQPRYICKNCRRYWTHGGTLRNIPIGGSARKIKRPKIDQPSVSQVISVEVQQVSHHQPFLHVQETNEFVGTFGGSSSSASTVVAVGNHFSTFPEIHGDMVLPNRSFPPIDRLDISDGSFHQNYYDVGSNDLMDNPLVNQPIGGHVDNYNSYCIHQEDQNKQSFNSIMNQSFNSIMNMNHNASTSGTGGYSGIDHMNKNNNKINKCVPRSSYHMEKYGP